ncbi:MAG: metallophosphoesterase family protein [Lachnospiraceae bacterium]|nr:metallophosphoesterase family protein [Lachnospiraceae bacterium]
MKKIAAIADIHGNYIAFDKCVEYALQRGVDTFLLLGDFVAELPYPQKTMERLYALKEKYECIFIRGNKEDYWLEHQRNGNSKVVLKDNDSTTGMLLYTYNNLTEKDLKFYDAMPIVRKIQFAGYPSFTVCHGTPYKANEKMIPSTDRIHEIMNELDTDLIVCGHTHIQSKYEYNGKKCLNTGACGIALGGKIEFIILQGDENGWIEELVSLDYDVSQVLKDIEESGIEASAPSWTKVTKDIIKGGHTFHSKVLFRAMDLCEEELGECNWPEVPEKYWEMAIKEMLYEEEKK